MARKRTQKENNSTIMTKEAKSKLMEEVVANKDKEN
jgi:hypothetical protein